MGCRQSVAGTCLVGVGAELARTSPPLCGACLAEPLEDLYFGAAPGSLEPPRLRAPTREAFEQAARYGKVLLIENASLGTAMEGWTCERLAQEFPEARMRREYDWVTNPSDRNLQVLGSEAWVGAKVEGEGAQDRLRQDPQAPRFAPFYWGVREHRKGDIGSEKVVQRVSEAIQASVPAFMHPDNAVSLFDNAEFWLGAQGTGARAHMDSHCISTLSVVLSGERRWRIGPVPRMPSGAGRNRDEEVLFDDGVAYKLGWRPMFEFTAKAGEAVLFPPGWIHETLNTAEGCTAALTTQFTIPRPVRYYRSFYNRLRRIGDLSPCWSDMRRWASLGLQTSKLLADTSEAGAVAEQLFDARAGNFSDLELEFYDVDGDGQVARKEFAETFAAWLATERAIRKEKKVRVPKVDMNLQDAGPAPMPKLPAGRGEEL